MSEERDPLIEQAVFGKEVSAFLGSNVGRFVIARANAKAADALDKFKTCDPENAKQMRDLQNEIHVAESILDWLIGAVKQGLQAENILDDPG